MRPPRFQTVVLCVALSALLPFFLGVVQADEGPPRRVIFNQDFSELFVETFGPATAETIDEYIESLAGTSVSDVFINVNCQRTNYRSRVWEAAWDGYDSAAGDDQPFFGGEKPDDVKWILNMRAMYVAGCDYPARIIAQCRRRGLRPWLSVRMNDSHFPDKPNHPYHSMFWREHPRWRIARGSLDFGRLEVREHYLALVRELCERYDFDGLELDFMRFGYFFREGEEHAGAAKMTELVREARKLTESAAKRTDRDVKLAVRVHTRPWVAKRHGLDAVAWAKEGLVDLVTAAPFWNSIDNDIPVETWRGLLAGTKADFAAGMEVGLVAGRGAADTRQTVTVEDCRGFALSAMHRGADAVYLFNLFTEPYRHWDRDVYHQFLCDAGRAAGLAKKPRRYATTLADHWAEGEPGEPAQLPSEGKRAVFRIYLGPKPLPSQTAIVSLRFGGGGRPQHVRVNGILCAIHAREANYDRFRVPRRALSEAYNLIEAEGNMAFEIVWVDVAIE